jgi:O-acetyl-ADP-ribose deacetylase (regulator of RNase III)
LAPAASVDAPSVAFPAISTGIYGFPFDRAAPIAVGTVRRWISDNAYPQTVTFVFLRAEEAAVYERLLARR